MLLLTGKALVSVRWVDLWKAGLGEVRCRLVARHFKGDGNGRDDLFAATPPLEAVRMQLSRATTGVGRKGRRRKMELIDAKKAHLNPRCTRDEYIELPPEAGAKEGMCGKLEYWLYGFRDAASAWEAFY